MQTTISSPAAQAFVTWREYRALLARYLVPLRARAVLLGALILAATGLQVYTPQISAAFVDAAVDGHAVADLIRLALLFLGLAFGSRLVLLASTYLTQDLKWRTTNRLRGDLARHCLRLGMPFFDAHTPGEMVERIDGDVMALANLLSAFVLHLVANGLLLLGVLLALALENYVLGLVFAVYTIVTFLLLRRTIGLASPAWRAEREASARVYGYLEERLGGTEDIRTCAAEKHTVAGFYAALRQQFLAARPATLLSVAPWAVAFSMFALNEGAGFLLGLRLYDSHSISLGVVYLILQYASMVSRPLELISRQIQDLQTAGASLMRVSELFSAPVESVQSCQDGDGTQTAPAGLTLPAAGDGARPPALRCSGVCFAYTPDVPVLDDVSFDLPAGQVLGLLGRTGSGKTTIARLLLRFYTPARGVISLSEGDEWRDIQSIALSALRRRIGVVTQNVQLFGANVRDNLTLFGALRPAEDPAACDARLVAILSELGLRDWYDQLPQGLDTLLESNGAGLSAGQAQLLTLARLFLQDPGLVILDEATSRLDPVTERLVDRAVGRLLSGRTAIIIAHRLSTVLRADRVVILDNGRVLEQGERTRLAADPSSRFAALLRTGMPEALE